MELRRIGVYTITVDPTALTIRYLNDEEIKVYYSDGYLDLYDNCRDNFSKHVCQRMI